VSFRGKVFGGKELEMTMRILFAGMVLLAIATGVWGDWSPGDDHKMHFPQLPDPYGWDINFCSKPADDWLCSQTGLVDDIHTWFSEQNDESQTVERVSVWIYANDPNYLGRGYSAPGSVLWQGEWLASLVNGNSNGNNNLNDFSVVTSLYGTGGQGFYSPLTGSVTPYQHQNIYQLNITDIVDPFRQIEGEIYWLRVDIFAENHTFGWKTADLSDYPTPYTGNIFMDSSTYVDNDGFYNPITDPHTSDFLDLAFVITPEPGTMTLLVLGAWTLFCRRK